MYSSHTARSVYSLGYGSCAGAGIVLRSQYHSLLKMYIKHTARFVYFLIYGSCAVLSSNNTTSSNCTVHTLGFLFISLAMALLLVMGFSQFTTTQLPQNVQFTHCEVCLFRCWGCPQITITWLPPNVQFTHWEVCLFPWLWYLCWCWHCSQFAIK